MKRIIALAATMLCLTAGACNHEAPPPTRGGVNITAPGVNVQTDPNGGVGVKAPGLNINVSPPK